MRKRDWADDEAERLFDMVRDGADDADVTEAIAAALRIAHYRGFQRVDPGEALGDVVTLGAPAQHHRKTSKKTTRRPSGRG